MILLFVAMLAVAPIKTSLSKTATGWEMQRGGKPYFVNGAGGSGHLGELAAAGGNSFRTWGVDSLDRNLAEAEAHGLTVAAGIWLLHKEGLDYGDAAKVREQYDRSVAAIAKFKDNPSLLIWGIGNEMEAGNDTPELWKAVGQIVTAAKQIDPNHLVMTVVADVSPEKIALIKQYAPDLDLLGINSYGGLPNLPERLKQYGWDKPYIVTEFGPRGPWERPKTSWGAPIEQTSTEKAAFYGSSYEHSIKGQPGWCLGSYAFLWGDKEETTPTWFGMFLPSGEPLASVDVMQHAWTGIWPSQRAPTIQSFALGVDPGRVVKGSMVKARVGVGDAQGLQCHWEIRPEVAERKRDGQGEVTPAAIGDGLETATGTSVSFRAPDKAGAYRLYVTAKATSGKAATANIPFLVS